MLALFFNIRVDYSKFLTGMTRSPGRQGRGLGRPDGKTERRGHSDILSPLPLSSLFPDYCLNIALTFSPELRIFCQI
jgi:hypothetical protein